MPRDIVLGNGEMLVNLDNHLNIRDLYYPYVGWANHVGGHYCRTGVWTSDAGFSWLDDTWEWHVQYSTGTLVTKMRGKPLALATGMESASSFRRRQVPFV